MMNGLTCRQAGWSLRWINLFFTPAFVLLPLSPPIGVSEVFKIIGVFRKPASVVYPVRH
jgi:hypothetical protein